MGGTAINNTSESILGGKMMELFKWFWHNRGKKKLGAYAVSNTNSRWIKDLKC